MRTRLSLYLLQTAAIVMHQHALPACPVYLLQIAATNTWDWGIFMHQHAYPACPVYLLQIAAIDLLHVPYIRDSCCWGQAQLGETLRRRAWPIATQVWLQMLQPLYILLALQCPYSTDVISYGAQPLLCIVLCSDHLAVCF